MGVPSVNIQKGTISIVAKMLAVVLVASVGMGFSAYQRVASIRPTEMDSRELKVRSLVEIALSIVNDFYEQEKSGKLSGDEARQGAIRALRSIRYGQGEYFWINDNPSNGSLASIAMIMHPTKPDLEKQNVSTLKDSDGKFMIQEFVKKVRADGSGFVSYQWPKPGGTTPVPKLSYVSSVPQWNWIIGTGIYIDDVDVAVAKKTRETLIQTIIVIGLLTILLGLTSAAIVRPIRRVTDTLRRLAREYDTTDTKRDSAGEPQGRTSLWRDEIGQMSSAVDILRQNLEAKANLEKDNEVMRVRLEEEKRHAAQLLATEVRNAVDAVASRMTVAVETMQTAAQDLGEATERLSASVDDIGNRVEEGMVLADAATQQAENVTTTVTSLTQAAGTIGGVVGLIKGVAEQTNLLALNATIEAARVGELGKGFAVVAGEVKALASQSASATDEIAHEIESIQSTSQEAASTLNSMSTMVEQLSRVSREVSHAIKDSGSHRETMNIHETTRATGEVSQRIQVASDDLATEADHLRTQFDDLVRRITSS